VSPSGQFLYTTTTGAGGSGHVHVASIAPDGTLTPVACSALNCAAGAEPAGLAITPSGRFAYVANSDDGTISAYSVNEDGSLRPLSCPAPTCTGLSGPNGVTIDPAGRFLYVTAISDNKVAPFAIGDDGSLTPIACNPIANCATGLSPQDIAMAPSGRFVYTTNSASDSVSVLAVGADGSLSPVSCNPATDCKTGDTPDGVGISPSGRFLYVSSAGTSNNVTVFSVHDDGSLSPVPCSPAGDCNTGTSPNFQALAVQPDQGPAAAFRSTPAPAGSATGFDASGSTDPDGQVARFDWSFGDGTTQDNGGPTPQHTYANPGTYTVSLRVADNSGCSTGTVFTGRTALCHGSAAATTSAPVTVGLPASGTLVVPDPSLSSVSQSAKKWRIGKKLPHLTRKAKVPVGTTFSFGLNVAAKARFAFTQARPGRRVGTRCVAQTKRNRSKRKCTRTVSVGVVSATAHAGANKERFQGRFSRRKKLKTGRYKVTITASDTAGHTSKPRSLSFTIVK
jgi:DNA-binding beta-propeller fold protein YncE